MNSYEIAILRILVKRNLKPIAIHGLVEGFPDGSEDEVNYAISNLESLELISILSGFPIEEKYLIYNQDKKQEILKIIDPLYAKIKENRLNINGYIYDNKVQGNRNKNKNNYHKLSLGQSVKPVINVTITIIFVIAFAFAFILTTVPQTSEVEQVYDFPYKHSKFKNGESQVYGNDDKEHWKVKAMNKDFRNHFIYYQFDKTENLSTGGISDCQNI